MKSFKIFTVTLILLVLLTFISSSQVITEQKVIEELEHRNLWALKIYNGWLVGDITFNQLIDLFEQYDENADENYKKVLETDASATKLTELTLTVIRYRSALLDIIEVLRKGEGVDEDEKIFTGEDQSILIESYVALCITHMEFEDLGKEVE